MLFTNLYCLYNEDNNGLHSIPSFIILGSCIYELYHINGFNHNVWPKANSCHFLLFGERERPVIQPPVAAVVRLKAAEDKSLSPRKFPWKLASTGDV